MKKIIIISSILLSSFIGISQTLEERVQKLEQEIEIIKEVNTSLKNKYKLFKGEQMTRANDVEISFIRATGDKYGKTITVELLVNNIGESKKTKGYDFKILDETGNEFEYSKIKMGTEKDWYWVMSYKDAPVKVSITFDKTTELPVYVRRINFIFRDDDGSIPVSLDGAQIDWK